MIRSGLTVKLSVLLALIGVLASGLTGYYAYHANRTLLVDQAERSLRTSTDFLSRRLSNSISDVAADARVLATMPSAAQTASIDDGLDDNPGRERLAQVFASFMANHPEYLQIRLIARAHHGLELIRFDRDAAGAVRVGGEGLEEKAQFPYVFDTLALNRDQIYVSNITINHEHGAHLAEGRPTVRIGAPIVDAHDTTVGAIVLDVDLGGLLAMLKSDLPRDYHVYLTNEWGDFLVHPDSTQTFGFAKGRRVLVQDTFASTRALFDHSRDEVDLNGLDNPREAGDRIITFIRKPLLGAGGNRFVVLGLSKPLDDALAGASLLGESIVHMVLISSAIALALAILFARALTQPLQRLTDAATHFMSDKTMDELPIRRTDEIGVLARCFARMRREIKSQIDVLHSKQTELAHLASHDMLTDLPNRLLFMQQLEAAIAHASATGERLAVLFVDLDGFKQINDAFGHSAGDTVLIAVARRLRDVLAPDDVVARLGGDEFIVLTRGARADDAEPRIAREILDAINVGVLFNDEPMTVGASIGISRYPSDGMNAESLLLHADAAMYAAKLARDGRGAYRAYADLDDPAAAGERTRKRVASPRAGTGTDSGAAASNDLDVTL
ncbi:diguanylate cyclase domain-containing protein [Pararobbsia silviterrae]|uniref:Sensor domain-containing diguanylate cyclase n=1 Tax=Pararobbsia silviterrae TaxID=1792498 RepID=A0A494XW55_9BURK|nr:diguanylate cyclase [Pararobbsia silviterrae]RKP51823.1 sensor domain-containing diguanylate cyclase [Pararobbsia silviterrae]